MRRGTLIAAALLALQCAVPASAPAAGYTPPPTVQWESLLPPLGSPRTPQPHPVPGCPELTSACIDTEIAHFDALRRQQGCDHHAVFTTTYELLTEELRDTMRANPHIMRDPRWLYAEEGTFANLYYLWTDADAHGAPVPAAWRVAFEADRHGDVNALQDILLGINAHVQRDMPYMLASVGLREPDGTSRKPDHDVFNKILNTAFQRVLNEVAARFDPIVAPFAPQSSPLLGYGSNLLGGELVKAWRELVWRNAERLLDAKTQAQRTAAENTIEANAAATAHMIAAFQVPPGYRATRDAFCAAHVGTPLP